MSPTTIIDPQAIAGLRELNPDDPAFLRDLRPTRRLELTPDGLVER